MTIVTRVPHDMVSAKLRRIMWFPNQIATPCTPDKFDFEHVQVTGTLGALAEAVGKVGEEAAVEPWRAAVR